MDSNSLWVWCASIWDVYKEDVDAYVGIFNLAGAILTAGALVFTAVAAIAAGKSTKVSQQALELAEKNSKRDDFNRHFTLLLEQHNLQLDIVKGFLDSKEGKKFYESLRGNTTLKEANTLMHGHSIVSPYMRVLYHLLKYIRNEFTRNEAPYAKKNEFSSLVRSLIRNDVLYLVALNSCYTGEIDGEVSPYAQYQSLLHFFSFFEHAKFYKTAYDENANAKVTIDALRQSNDTNIFVTIDDILNGRNRHAHVLNIPLPLIVASIYTNPDFTVSGDYLFNLHKQFPTSYTKRSETLIKDSERYSDMEYHFRDYIGKHAVSITEQERDDIHFRGGLSQEQLSVHPVIDIDFIRNSLVNFEQVEYETPKNIFFCFLSTTNDFYYYYPSNFDATCHSYIKILEKKQKLESNFYYSEFESYMDLWKDYLNEIQSKCVSSEVRKKLPKVNL